MPPLSLPHRLFLVRHGETDWNREGRLQGGQDIPLNALGEEQAAEAADRLRGLVSGYGGLDFVASPMKRARRTMEILRHRLGLPQQDYRLEPDLRELTFGRWEGLAWKQVRKQEPALAKAREADKWGFVPPGGESYEQLAIRVRPVLEGLTRETVLVSHGGVARAVLALIEAVDPAEAAMIDIWQGKILLAEGGEAHWV